MNVVRPSTVADVGALAALMIEFYRESDFALPREAAERTFGALLRAPELGQAWLLESDGDRGAGFADTGHVPLALPLADPVHAA